MERIQEINELRKGTLSEDFVTNHPQMVKSIINFLNPSRFYRFMLLIFNSQAQLIKRLVTSNADSRPTAADLLNEVSDMKDYKDTADEKDQTIKRLQQELSFKDELIAVLAEKLSTLEMLSKNGQIVPSSNERSSEGITDKSS